MAVDGQAVRKDIFDLLQMFGPANAGGPPQANTNPGANDKPQPDLATVPPPQPAPPDPATTGSVPQQSPYPSGVRVLPQATPIKDNSAQATAAARNSDVIELLPGDADPNILPPEIRDSPLFRYMQAQRAAQFKQSEQDARWQNVIGGIGNIASILQGGQPGMTTSARAEPGAPLKLDDLRNLQGDIAKTKKEAATTAALDRAAQDLAKYTGQPVEVMRAIVAAKPEKLADIAENRVNINDDEKERLRVNADLERNGQRPYSPIDWHMLSTQEKIAVQQAQGQGAPGKGFTDALVKETVESIATAGKARDAMTSTQQALSTITDPTSKLWVGGFYGDPTIQGAAKYLSGVLGQDLSGITDAEVLRSRVGQILFENAKAFGATGISDEDRRVISSVVGADGRINRDALATIMRDNLRRQVQSQLAAQSKVKQSGEVFKDDPRSQAYLGSAAARLADVPDLTGQIFRDETVNALIANRNSPEVIADFNRRYGPGMAEYVIAKRGGPVGGQ